MNEKEHEAYRVGWNAGHDFGKQQDRAEIAGLKCTVTRLEEEKNRMGVEILSRMHMEKYLRDEVTDLKTKLKEVAKELKWGRPF